MESLSDEMVMEILSRVRTLDLEHARFVCKRWKTIMEEPRWHKLHCSRSISNPNNKILIVGHGNKLGFVDLSDEFKSASRAKLRDCVPSDGYFKIVGLCNGLLCLTDSVQIYIKNPFTDEDMRQLPALPDENLALLCGFGHDSITNSYKVMAIVSHYLPEDDFDEEDDFPQELPPRLSQVMVCECGNMMNWRKVGETPYCLDAIKYPQVYLNGRLHWIHGFKEIVSFDFTDEKLRLIPLPNSLILCATCDLIVFQNRLCIVGTYQPRGTMQLQLQVWIMKKYDVKDSWVKEYDTESLGLGIRKPLKSVPGPMNVSALGEVGNGKILFHCTAACLACMLLYEPLNNHKYEYVEFEGLPNCVFNPSLSRIS